MTRVTNSVLTGAGVLVISIILLLQKQYLNLFWNALGFLLGFAAVFAPFALYFTWKNCFQEFIYGTFIYNFEYAHKMPSWIKNVCFNNMITFFNSISLTGVLYLLLFLHFGERHTALHCFIRWLLPWRRTCF